MIFSMVALVTNSVLAWCVLVFTAGVFCKLWPVNTAQQSAKSLLKYRIGKDIGVKFQDKHGKKRIRLLWKGSLARDPYPLGKEADIIHKPKGILKKPSLGARLKANRCEWCGKETSMLVMHQVRMLKELDESQPWAAFMKKINRKTLAVCESCHTKIHSADCE